MVKTSIGFQIGKILIPYYGSFIVLGIAVAAVVGTIFIRKYKKNIYDFIALAAITVLGGFLGAKLLYLIVSWKEIDFSRLTEPEYFERLMQGGFVFYGGLIGGLICMFFINKKLNIDVKEYIKICIPCVPIAHGFGRLGCNAVGCCYGKAYDGFGAIIYHDSVFAPNNISLFPVQLAEAAAEFLLAGILCLYILKSKNPKYSLPIYLGFYSIIRFFLEYFRADERRGKTGVFFTSQWISLVIFAGIVLYSIKQVISALKREKEYDRIKENNVF